MPGRGQDFARTWAPKGSKDAIRIVNELIAIDGTTEKTYGIKSSSRGSRSAQQERATNKFGGVLRRPLFLECDLVDLLPLEAVKLQLRDFQLDAFLKGYTTAGRRHL